MLKRAWLESESLVTALNEYKARVKNLGMELEDEGLNQIAVLMELKRVKQYGERLESEDKLTRRTTEHVRNGNLQEGSWPMRFVD